MARRVAFVLAVAAALAAEVSAGTAELRDDRLAQVRTFALGLGSSQLRGDLAQRFAGYDLVVVDGEEVTAAQVASLKAQGTIVLGYVSVGTIEPSRSWYPEAKPYRLELWEDWGEYYADTSKAGFRRLIADEVAPMILAKGVDGLFLDNVDMISTHRPQRAGMHALVRALAAKDGYLFAQNGDDVIRPLLEHLDGWNREDVSRTYDFDRKRYLPTSREDREAAVAALERAVAHGLVATATDYVRKGDTRAIEAATRTACAAGAIPFHADIALERRPPQPPPSCSG